MTDTPTTGLLAAADSLLDQCERILNAVSDEAFCAESAVLAGGTIGKHLRHTLDHYAAIAACGAEEPIVYDRRRRGGAAETDRAAARGKLGEIRGALGGLAVSQESVRVRVMLSGDGSEATLRSTLAREIAFATHHGVHHVAMMKAIAAEHGAELDAEIGRAPSTVHHDRSGR